MSALKAHQGVLVKEDEIKERWRIFFYELLNENHIWNSNFGELNNYNEDRNCKFLNHPPHTPPTPELRVKAGKYVGV